MAKGKAIVEETVLAVQAPTLETALQAASDDDQARARAAAAGSVLPALCLHAAQTHAELTVLLKEIARFSGNAEIAAYLRGY
jgi:hypothetical protein